jgi:hypothetical protein
MIQQRSSWLNSLNISFATSRRYDERLVEKNTGTIVKLRRRLEKSPYYLKEIGGFDEEDIIDIKEGLMVSTGGSSGMEMYIAPADTPEHIANMTVVKIRPLIVVPPPRNTEEDSSTLIEDTVKIPVVPLLSSVGNSIKTVSTGGQEKLPSFQSKIDQEGKEIPPLQLQGSLGMKEELSNSPMIPASGSSIIFAERGKCGIEPRVSSVGHSNRVTSLSWSPVSNKIASGPRDDTIKV